MSLGRKVNGNRIAELRLAKKLDQTELATRLRKRGLGANQATISRWENGQEPRSSALMALAAELGVSVEELFADDESEAASPVSARADNLAEALRAEIRTAVRAEIKEGQS